MGVGKENEVTDEERHEHLLRLLKGQGVEDMKNCFYSLLGEKYYNSITEEDARRIKSLHDQIQPGTVEQCLLDGLKKRPAAFFRNKIAYLFTKVGKEVPQVAEVVAKIQETEAKLEKITVSEDGRPHRPLTANSIASGSNEGGRKHLWVRMAITEKVIDKITEYLVSNHRKFYEKSSIMADSIRGKILSSLLVGPCALDYTKVKTHDHYWSDPPAEELLQRHKLHSRGSPRPDRRLALRLSSASQRSSIESSKNGSSFRDYVESLHQNSKVTLLYGKNNVIMEPEGVGVIPGYLSLHQESSRLMFKWTPNQLMYGADADSDPLQSNGVYPDTCLSANHGWDHKHDDQSRFSKRKFLRRVFTWGKRNISSYWDFAISVDVRDIVYLHCHQHEKSSTLVLIGQDGVQWSPIRFPPGGQLLTFLTSLETALLPHGYLDPPLWSQKGKGKVFPRVRRKSYRKSESSVETDETADFVFRVATSVDSSSTLESTDEFVPNLDMYTWDQSEQRHYNDPKTLQALSEKNSGSSLRALCDSMKRQIISRAFYGWLAHCRHLSGVRTHLTELVHRNLKHSGSPTDATVGVTEQVWNELVKDGKLTNYDELARHVYFGGVQAKHLRKIVWLYLLGYYPPGCNEEERNEIDVCAQRKYEHVRMLDEVIKQRAAELPARHSSSGGTSISSFSFDGVPKRLVKQQSSLSDVFYPHSDQNNLQKIVQDKLQDIETDLTMVQLKHSSSVRNFQEKRRKLRKRSQSEDSHIPYSSISTMPSMDNHTSFSVTSISMDEDCPVLGPLPEENEVSSSSGSESEFGNESPDRKTEEAMDKGVSDTVHNIQPDSSSITTTRSSGSNEDPFCANLSQIEKDVYRCDRNHSYFTQADNLVKLGNIMSCFVWEHPDVAYVQGMCDLVAPLLVLFDDESLVYACFVNLMQRISFHKGNSMDVRLANLRSLIQVLDYELYEHLCKKTDDTHFFFCYRWFLLEFKRELSYDEDVFAVWERSWAARTCSTDDFGLFFGLAMLETYRDIILENEMDFSSIVKFFNEMAEKHDANALVQLAQKFVADVQHMVEK